MFPLSPWPNIWLQRQDPAEWSSGLWNWKKSLIFYLTREILCNQYSWKSAIFIEKSDILAFFFLRKFELQAISNHFRSSFCIVEALISELESYKANFMLHLFVILTWITHQKLINSGFLGENVSSEDIPRILGPGFSGNYWIAAGGVGATRSDAGVG